MGCVSVGLYRGIAWGGGPGNWRRLGRWNEYEYRMQTSQGMGVCVAGEVVLCIVVFKD